MAATTMGGQLANAAKNVYTTEVDPLNLSGQGTLFTQNAKNINMGPTGSPPKLANIQQGTDAGDVMKAQQTAGNSLQAQQNLLAALQGQNGLGLQSNLANQLQGANGVGTQNSAIQGLQGAANMYGQIAQGGGPNPAAAMLNQQTGANIANQAALMAGQRGAGANAGLLARQAGQQGGALQQNAVGQGATMQANQQLNALQGLVGAQNAVGGLGSNQVGQQAGMANQIAGQQIGQVNANTQAALSNQQQMQNALAGINQANVANQASVNAGNTALANTTLQGKQGLVGGLLNSLGTGFTAAGAHGGEVVKMANGGIPADAAAASNNGAQSSWGKYLTMAIPILSANANPSDQALFGFAKNALDQSNKKQQNMADGGEAKEFDSAPDNSPPASGDSSSSWGKYMNDTAPAIDTNKQDQSTLGEIGAIAAMFKDGGMAENGGAVKAKNPNQKAKVPGNSYSNDLIPAKLSEGEFVLNREVMESSDPASAAANAVREHLAKNKSNNMARGGSPKMMADNPVPETAPTEDQVDVAAPDIAQVANVPQQPAEASTQDNMSHENPSVLQSTMNEPEIPATVEGNAQELHNRNIDLANKQVTPKTMWDLWKDKSVPGKIATIFGLMMSGAGSGLAHQQNAALEMMNKIVDRDLEAQKVNKEGARNFLTMEADIANKNIHTQLGKQKLFGESLENDKNILMMQKYMEGLNASPELIQEATDRARRANQSIWADARGEITAKGAAIHDLKDKFGNMPQAQAAFPTLDQWLAQKSNDRLNQAGTATAANTKAIADQSLAQGYSGEGIVDPKVYQQFKIMAPEKPSDAAILKMPTRIQMDNLPNEITAIKGNRSLKDEYDRVVEELKKIPAGGETALTAGAGISGSSTAMAAAKLAEKYNPLSQRREALLARLKKELGDDFTENMVPGLGSTKKSLADAQDSAHRMFAARERTLSPTLTQFPQLAAKMAPSKETGAKKGESKGSNGASKTLTPKTSEEDEYEPIGPSWLGLSRKKG